MVGDRARLDARLSVCELDGLGGDINRLYQNAVSEQSRFTIHPVKINEQSTAYQLHQSTIL